MRGGRRRQRGRAAEFDSRASAARGQGGGAQRTHRRLAEEQQGAGLDQCTPEQFDRITALNDAYHRRFGFPFILAVRGHTRDSIIANMDRRLTHAREVEVVEALHQIERIAGFRLADIIAAGC